MGRSVGQCVNCHKVCFWSPVRHAWATILTSDADCVLPETVNPESRQKPAKTGNAHVVNA